MLDTVKGYVRVQATGFNIERFINMATFHGVYIWDAQRTASGIEFSISIKDFKKLKNSSRKTKTRIKITKKYGIPFLIFRYRKRKALAIGIVFFMLGLFLLSSFIWRIDIEGNDRLATETVMAFLEENGLRVGSFKPVLNEEQLQHAILLTFEEINWVEIHTRGTRTTIELSESLPALQEINRQIPTNVYAAEDGLITRVTAWGGAPMVKQGDVVRQGDLLVSGILELEPDMPNNRTVYVHAHAEIWARRYHPIEFSLPFTRQEKVFTGETFAERNFLLLGNFQFRLPNSGNPFVSYDRITTYNQPGANGNFPLPIVMATTLYSEFVWQERILTLDEAIMFAEGQIYNRLLQEFNIDTDIINKRIEYKETQDYLLVSALITTHERIDKQVPIPVESH